MKADFSLAQVRRDLPAWREKAEYHVPTTAPALASALDNLSSVLDSVEEHALASTGLNCCDVAKIKPCVCEIARTCPVHGDLHRGSHD